LKCFLLSKSLVQKLGAFLPLPLPLPLFLSVFFFALSLEDSGVLMIFEEKITSSKTSFEMASTYWRWTHILEWSYARQHG
jgi:hypothetical protein